MKKVLSIILAITIIFALSSSAFAMLPEYNRHREYEMEDKIKVYNENWEAKEYDVWYQFDECYGVIEIPDYGKIPVVREGSNMRMVFFGEERPEECFYKNYPIEMGENYAGEPVPVYVDPETGETAEYVMGTHMICQIANGTIEYSGVDENTYRVVSGEAFEVYEDVGYWYTMYNGLNKYFFHNRSDYAHIDQPMLCTVLALNDEQIVQFKETGVITFDHPYESDFYEYDWSYDFKGTDLRALLVYGEKSIDVHNPSSWAADVTARANAIGISQPVYDFYGEIYYKYDITREEFAGMIVKMLEKSVGINTAELAKNTEINFDDVYDNNAIYAAAELGIIKGRDDGSFCPSDRITRQEIAVMLDRTYRYVESVKGVPYITGIESDLGRFSDASLVAPWASESVGRLVNKGIINGMSETTLAPLSNTTVEQSISLVMRLYDEITA